MTAARTMLVLDAGPARFQLRAAALIRREGHLLVHRATRDPFWALPGGRVELGETGAETLVREIGEEMGVGAETRALRFVVENFFTREGRRGHEIGLYYDVALTAPFPFHAEEIVHRSGDGSAELEFRWVVPSPALLARLDFKPAALHPLLDADGARGPVHLVHRDGAP